MMGCPICAIREENEMLQAKSEAEWLEIGASLVPDHTQETPLPYRITLNTRPTDEQWRRMLDLLVEIETHKDCNKGE